jgi:hypothetical protein
VRLFHLRHGRRLEDDSPGHFDLPRRRFKLSQSIPLSGWSR